ncbi:hypothetical protein FEM48_Zijuj08G0102900 [Ziziphus jujuba var. spinosa]|uniref:F-box protein At5g07610-like n=2 Tax=Ziziphus jujuba TaxID=326968 RepID=A0A978UYI6_ZIZJJ|nr:F-box protein At5g07610 isoform X1 [Ziziphus jujuba var. spinosa]KAH7520052.1 hypothetical protein FEM48_Zijuj08G0102900 [Ziziphus jujuba var. spinosa]
MSLNSPYDKLRSFVAVQGAGDQTEHLMDRGKKENQFITNKNSKIYMDLKDIIREHVLSFLPAKSLSRFRAVCRDWKLQISTPFFAHNQSNGFHEISGFFCQSGSNPPSFISLDPAAYGVPDPSLKFLPEPVDIRTSSNGLLCCQGLRGLNAYYICNPVTKQWKMLPKPNASHGSDPALVLIFEPSVLNFVADYKLICAFPSVDFDNGYEFEIYSSREGVWKVFGEIYFGNKKLLPRSGVHVNGIIYWQATDGGIVVFDLVMERTQLLYGDYDSYNGYRSGTLGMMNGKLCLTKVHQPGLVVLVLSNAYKNTMQMRSNVKTWEQKHQICLSSSVLSGAASNDPNGRNVLFAGGNIILVRSGGKLYSYDMKTKAVQCLLDELDQGARAVAYVNSLVEI